MTLGAVVASTVAKPTKVDASTQFLKMERWQLAAAASESMPDRRDPCPAGVLDGSSGFRC